jgi:hypothetical protein
VGVQWRGGHGCNGVGMMVLQRIACSATPLNTDGQLSRAPQASNPQQNCIAQQQCPKHKFLTTQIAWATAEGARDAFWLLLTV